MPESPSDCNTCSLVPRKLAISLVTAKKRDGVGYKRSDNTARVSSSDRKGVIGRDSVYHTGHKEASWIMAAREKNMSASKQYTVQRTDAKRNTTGCMYFPLHISRKIKIYIKQKLSILVLM